MLRKKYILLAIFLLIFSVILTKTKKSEAAVAGDLIKLNGISSVYYLGDDGKRYVFPAESIYFSWYKDFNSVITVSQEELQTYPLGGNVAMRAGTKLVKITSNPAVYAVEPGGNLRKINSEAQALKLFGPSWSKRVVDIPDAFFTDYSIGDNLTDGEWPKGSLIKDSGTENYYYYDANGFHKIDSAETFRANRFYSEYILQSSESLNGNQGTQIVGEDLSLLSLIKNNNHNQASNNQSGNNNSSSNSGVITGGGGGGGGGGSSGGGGGSSNSCFGDSSRGCTIENGNGIENRTCSSGSWSSWGSCTVSSCNSGYQISGNTCVAMTCEGSSSQTCSISNGQGLQTRTCNAGLWSSWGSCTVSSCNSGYQISGNTCVVVGNMSLSLRQHLVHNQNFAIPSNAINGDVVGQLNNFWANWEGKTVSYSITSGSGFSINNNGLITLSDQTVISGQSDVTLGVRAQDSTNQEYEDAQITISILPSANTYFIDPSVATNGDGSRTSPYKSWSNVTFTAGKNYLQKRGTEDTITARVSINNLDNIIIGAYGNNFDRPKIKGWNLTGSSNGAMGLSGNNNIIRDLDIDAKLSTSGIYSGGGNNNQIDNCRIQNSEWGLRTMNAATGFKILNSEIAYTGDDGHYSQNRNSLEIAFNYIHNVNQHWNENSYWYAGKTEALAAGDGIQLNGTVFDFNIHHNIIDRSDTDNKFCVIVSPLSSTTDTHGLLEHNYCKLRPDSNESGFYLFRGLVGVKVRYNTFVDDTGIWSHSPDLLIAYNIFNNSRIFIGDNGASYKVYNNVFYDIPANLAAVSLWTDNVDMKNNIFYFTNDTSTGLQTSSQHTILHDNNLFYPNFRGTYGQAANDIVSNPLFIDAANGDFRLQTESQAIGGGTPVGETNDFFGKALNNPLNIGIWEN